MPIYEYQCENCQHKFDKLQKMSEAVLKDCPECKQPQLRKLISSAGFQLKGGGWYVTDFKNSGNSKTKTNVESSAKKEPSSDSKTKKTQQKN